MPKHRLQLCWRVTFDDGSAAGYNKIIRLKDHLPVYHFHSQKGTYIISFLEQLISKENITDKVRCIEEFYEVEEVEPYQSYIGL